MKRSKIVVLGGAGEVGRWVSQDLVARDSVAELVIAEVAFDKAAELAETLGGKARAVQVDPNSPEQLLGELADADLLMNCTSHVFFDSAFDLALKARVNYADLISEPTDFQREAALNAGITAVSGLGLSPGLTQVLVRHAVDELDIVEEAHISGVSWRTIAPSRGGLETVLWELSNSTTTRQYFQGGRYRQAAYMEGSRCVDFLPPIGRHQVYYVPHPETTSLTRNFPQLSFCATRVSWRDEIMDDMRVLNKYGLLDPAPVAGMDGLTIREAIRDRIWDVLGGERDDKGWAMNCTVEIVGQHNGQGIIRTYQTGSPDWHHDATGRITGTCAAVGAEILAQRKDSAPGWIDPETIFDPYEFLEALEERGSISVIQSEKALDGKPIQRA
jgi:saccharopine dehydrogenase-like NADP-dependent oxidoreductase